MRKIHIYQRMLKAKQEGDKMKLVLDVLELVPDSRLGGDSIPFGQTHRWIPVTSVHLLQSDVGLHPFLQWPREV